MFTFHCYNDPAHGWIRVPFRDLVSLGIEKKISGFSYSRGRYVYLEEDCDAAVFLKAMSQAGKELKLIHHYSKSDSSIRRYDRYEIFTPAES